MSNKTQKKRDKHITREIHRLFWRHTLNNPLRLVLGMSGRFPAFMTTHLLMPLVVANALQAIIERQFDSITGYAYQLLLLAAIFSVLWAISNYLVIGTVARAGRNIQREVFANFLHKDYDFYANTYFGALGDQASRLREAFIGDYCGVFLLAVPKQLVVIVGGIVVIATKSPLLALVTLGAMASVLGFTMLTSSMRIKWRRKVSEESSAIAAKLGDALTQAPAVKSFASEDYESKRLDHNLNLWERAQFTAWMSSVPADAGRYFLVALATAILLVMTGRMYRDGAISIAIVALVQLYVVKMVAATIDINDIIKSYESAVGGAYQPIKTMLIQPTIVDSAKPDKLPRRAKYPVTLQSVSYKYDNTAKDAVAVRDFTLDIAPGEKVGLVGFSGSGKTTLTKLLLRFMDITSGSIAIAGKDIRSIAQKDLRRHISYVPQEPLLFHRSIAENIAYSKPTASNKELKHAAKMAYVTEFIEELPERYNTLVGERGVKLSGGQRQRVAIARAILKDAPILVLDEATSALDSRSEQLIQKALWSLMEDRTALVIAHRLSTIQRMDRIVVMDKGKVVQVGTHRELLRDKKGIYAELWAHQSGGYIGVPAEPEDDVGAISVA
ncbi:MAG TPA: ABC transporter ATP-binding protein [Verrucomicrobiae bacterium]|nr:ABC transporter ATP-binding protein [Verrucomicrobiae bacterium]